MNASDQILTVDNAAALRTLLDREAIRDCMYRYCRGIDRGDEAALRGSYWPDATDNHGAYQGSASGFIEYALPHLKSGRRVHMVGNILIEFKAEVAAVESYFVAFQQDRDASKAPRETLLCGRYVDRFECRVTEANPREWRVAARTVVYDWIRQTPLPAELTAAFFGARQPVGGVAPDDPIYALLNSISQP